VGASERPRRAEERRKCLAVVSARHRITVGDLDLERFLTSATPITTTDLDPLTAEQLRDRVDAVLATFLAQQSDALTEVSPDCHDLVDSVVSLMSGGKRLRPAFCYWGWRGAGGAACDEIVNAAAALELFQAAALIHDDLMDDSDLRRGMPAVHRRFAKLHAERGWVADGDRFGLAGAVLAGDMCLVWTDELFSGSGLSIERLAAGRVLFNRMRTELLGGQYLDVLTQAAPDPDPATAIERARQVIRYKSAKYTIEHPLLIGASLAGASDEVLASYSAYGLALGEAFQLRDDVLGVFGDPEETGKPAGDDLREGKRTVLVAVALQHADPQQAAEVRRLLGDPRLDSKGVDTLRRVIVDTGALETVERMITELTETAAAALRRADGEPVVAEPAYSVLSNLVVAATARAR
jgi:geranylgeranyl diphosphate synthase type I